MTPIKSTPPFRAASPDAALPSVQRTGAVEWSVLSRTLPGEHVSGDDHLVVPWSEGVLLAAVDGLGHGEEATAAARVAVDTLRQHAGKAVTTLMQHCHVALRQTRGVVMTLASLDTREQTLAVLGVGNVEMFLLRANPRLTPRRESVLLRGGVVGYQLPPLQVNVLPVSIGDLVVFATDGVREDFADLVQPEESVAHTVGRIMGKKFRGTDDGLVLAGKYVGAP